MLTKDFINTSLPLLHQNDKVKKALQLMQKFHLEHLTACINESYGFLSYDTLRIIPEDTPLYKIEQLLQKTSISTKDHIWKSISTFNQHEAEALPMLNEEKEYCGTVLGRDLFNRIREIFPIANGGAILELEMSYQSYSIHELGGIIEGANAKIIQLSLFPIEGTSKVNIVFSIDKDDASDVIQALERHSYPVNAWFMNKGKIDNILEERYDAFMKYINV
ncbi:MAG: hypothetical protein PF444_04775 [Bacteroidales bacterium]|jgi:acetoin utilization protein AcuB|nr:hypothetical protein [Bacteroidales bacterium]